jgi:phospholipase A-2-activating protein
LLCSYAVLSIESKDEQSQAQILSATLEVSFPAYYIQPMQFPEKSHVLHFLTLQIAEDDTQDFDSKYRALVAIGSLVSFFNIPLLQRFMHCNFIGFIISSKFSCFGMCCP